MNSQTLFSSLPNLITLGRLVLVPLIMVMISSQRWVEAFVIFVVAGVSDGVDGYIAKTFNLRTELGAYLDPLADKALLMTIYVALSINGTLPAWISILVVSRDIIILGAVIVSWLIDLPLRIHPLLISKLNTTAQIGFAGTVLGAKAFGFPTAGWMDTLLYLVAALTLASGAAYFAIWINHMSEGGGGQPPGAAHGKAPGKTP
jgi:cardiolipin synthase (CMP-forming)